MLVEDHETKAIDIDTTMCEYCKGDSAVPNSSGGYLTSKQWCEKFKVCAATIDWEKVYNHE